MRVDVVDRDAAEVLTLLRAHELEMARRYPGGSWEGTGGHKDIVWVARAGEGEEPVGLVALRFLEDGVAEVKHLFVVESARRSGVASLLMDALEAEARRRQATIVLETGTAQPEAIALYEARGYELRSPYDGCDADTACSVYLTRRGDPRWQRR